MTFTYRTDFVTVVTLPSASVSSTSFVPLLVVYEGMEETPSNYYDIMAVYMVKHGVGDTATVMNDTSKG